MILYAWFGEMLHTSMALLVCSVHIQPPSCTTIRHALCAVTALLVQLLYLHRNRQHRVDHTVAEPSIQHNSMLITGANLLPPI